MNHPQGLFKAIKHYGSREEFARILGVSRQIVGYWLSGERHLPEWMALRIFVLLKGAIPLKELSFNPKAIYDIVESVMFHTKNPTLQVPITEIFYGDFQCPIYGNNEHQLLNLTNENLDRPILITEKYRLITCTCRLLANALLGRRYIHVYKLNLMKVINQSDGIEAIIVSLPISEKVAVGLAIEQELSNRQGRRTNLELVENSAQFKRGIKTREIAAHIAGFNNHYTYNQAKAVVMKGIPDLIQAMDQQVCTINKADGIAKLSQAEQHQAVKQLSNSIDSNS